MKKIVLILLVLICVVIVVPEKAAAFSDIQEVDCASCLLVDMSTGQVLYQQDKDEIVYPASTTKIMTFLLVAKAIDEGELSLDDVVTVSENIYSDVTSVASTIGLEEGEEITIEDLLYAIMLPSACEACNVLAEAVSGSISDFIDLMNQTAVELGCQNTHFVNTHGLHDDDHYTTASDLALITMAAWQYDLFEEVSGATSYTIEATNMSDARYLTNLNALMTDRYDWAYYYEYCVAGKVGYTDYADHCLVSVARKDDVTLLCVVLGASGTNHFAESKRLLQWGIENLAYYTIASTGESFGEVTVEHSFGGKSVEAVIDEDVQLLLTEDVASSDVEYVVDLPESVDETIKEGEVLGTVTLIVDGEESLTLDLIASETARRSLLLVGLSAIGNFVLQGQILALLAVCLILIVGIMVVLWLKGKVRRE